MTPRSDLCSYCGCALTRADQRHNRYVLCRECCEQWLVKAEDQQKADEKAQAAYVRHLVEHPEIPF